MLKKIKQAMQKPLIAHIENAQLVLERWAFIVSFNVIQYLSRVCTPPPSITDALSISKNRLNKLLNFLADLGARLLTWLVLVSVILIFLLLPLMLLVLLYAVERVLLLSQSGLTSLRTKLSQVLSR